MGESVQLLLEAQINNEIITEFDKLEVSRDVSEPRQITVVCSIKPVFAVTWVYVRLGVEI